jgi:serine protease Do
MRSLILPGLTTRRASPAGRARLLAAALLLGGGVTLPLAAPVPALARGAPDSFADLAARLLPSVVNISSTETVSDTGGDDDDPDAGPGDNGDDGKNGGNKNGGKGGGDQGAPQIPTFPPGSPFEKFFHDFMNKHGQAAPGGGAPGAPARCRASAPAS